MGKANSQTEANKRWQEKNKERAKYLSDRSRAGSFIKKQATEEDLIEIMQLVAERKMLLNQDEKNKPSS